MLARRNPAFIPLMFLLVSASVDIQANAQSMPNAIGSLAGVKCIVDGTRSSHADFAVAYGGGWVFLSTQSAADRFEAIVASADRGIDHHRAMLTRANHQLALTRQVIQVRCPVSGQQINQRTSLSIGGVPVQFRDDTQRNVVEQMPGLMKRAERIFSPETFETTFEPRFAGPHSDTPVPIEIPHRPDSLAQPNHPRSLARRPNLAPHQTRCQR